MPYLAQKSLVKPFEPSSRAADWSARKPRCRRPQIVDEPATSGASGPDHDEVDPLRLAEGDDCRMVGGIERHAFAHPRQCRGCPGAQKSWSSSGLAAIFQASACSRPPEPIRRMFMRTRWLSRSQGVAAPYEHPMQPATAEAPGHEPNAAAAPTLPN